MTPRWCRPVAIAAALAGVPIMAGPAVTGHVAGGAQSLTAGEVLRRHAAARGGADRWAAVSALEISGSQTTFSVPQPFTLIRKRPNLYRFEQTVLRRPVVEVHDGSRSWWINGLMGNTWPLPCPEPAATAIGREAEFDTPLMGRAEAGRKVELKGMQEFEGRQAYALEVTRKDGAGETWYLDPNSFLELARVSKTVDFGQEIEKRSYFSDFRDESGLVLPHRIDMEYGTRNEVLEIQRVRLNPPLDSDLFRMPPPEGMGPLQFLAGDWSLKIETRPGPRAPWTAKETSASITRLLEGGLFEERFSHVDQGLAIEVVRTWSYDRFQKVYRLVQSDSFTFHANVLEGTMAEGKLTAANEKSGTTWATPDGTFHTRLIAYDFQPNGFKVDSETSADGGKSWNAEVKYSYTRK